MTLGKLELIHQRFVFPLGIVEGADLLHALRAEVYQLFLLHTLRLSIRRDALQGVEGLLELLEFEAAKGGAIVAVEDVRVNLGRMVEPLSCVALLF
jgi:hypothetical protein